MISPSLASSITPSIIYTATLENKKFIDRENYFDQIKEKLSSCGFVALVGAPQVGKSLTAIQYYHNSNWGLYEAPVYFDATTEKTFIKKYKEFAWLQGIIPDITPVTPRVNLILINKINEYLRVNPFLFIFDNVPAEESWIEKYLPESSKTHVIIVSRNPISMSYVPTVEIKPFTRDDSLAYIKKNLNKKCYGDSVQNAFSQADELACRLKDSPVHLEKAINDMNSCLISISEYLELFPVRNSVSSHNQWQKSVPSVSISF